MKTRMKRCATLLLTAALTASLMGTGAPARATGMTWSGEIVELIKEYEGFRSQVYTYGGGTYIGYGTKCGPGDYPDGVTREQAEALLEADLTAKGREISARLDRHGVRLEQHQFDALLSLTYNVGTAWMGTSSRLFTYLTGGLENVTQLQMVNAIATWCHMGTTVVGQLVERRLREAQIFLYADYAGERQKEYRYIKFDPDGGRLAHSIAFYEYGMPYGAIAEPQRQGYVFSGWYRENGAPVNPGDMARENIFVRAVWTDAGQPPKPAAGYSDVCADDWFYAYVEGLRQSGVLAGYPDGTFRPERPVTRGEALKLIMTAVGFGEQPPADGHWAGGYFQLAAARGLIAPDDTAAPDEEISRLEVASLAARALGLPPVDGTTVFADTADGYVLALYHCGIVTGSYDGAGRLIYEPGAGITRAQLSAVIWRIYAFMPQDG